MSLENLIETILAPLMIFGDMGYLILLFIIILDIIIGIIWIYDYNKKKEK